MEDLLAKWFKLYKDEIGLFFWSTLIFFLIHFADVLFNNFGETAFLKRYGVEYLPVVYMVNSILTFFIMAIVTGLMAAMSGGRFLGYLLLFCGTSVGAMRLLIPLGFELIYPVLFVMKTQYEVLLGLVFWNLANDLFNTRQSKRIFPLITAGGVLGGMVGSFGTPWLAKTISLDNLLWAYLVISGLGVIIVKVMGRRFPAILITEKRPKKKGRTPFLDEFKKVGPLLRESTLVKILVVITLLPNVVIPIINYQFNYVVDETFATEGRMIAFFAYFRGVMNIISLVLLLFVGKIYGKWGLPVSLMFHPANYLIAFGALLLRFDIVSAIYARITTTVLRTTINNPARAVLVGLIPAAYRSLVRPFLRGTVVRIGTLAGSGLVMLSGPWVHPKYLSVVAGVFVIVWFLSNIHLKRSYSKILLDLISVDMLDLKSLEEGDATHIFKDKNVKTRLMEGLSSARGDQCIWYARLLKSLGMEGLDGQILLLLRDLDDRTRVELIKLLSPEAGAAAIPVFRALADPEKPDLMIALSKAAMGFDPQIAFAFQEELFQKCRHIQVKAYAVSGLYRRSREAYRPLIDSWLDSPNLLERRAGVIAAGESGDAFYVEKLRLMLSMEEEGSILPFILMALNRLDAPQKDRLVWPFLDHSLESVRLAALEAFEIKDDEGLRKAIELMGDPSLRVHELAKQKLQTAPHQNGQLLVESIGSPRRKVREGVFQLLESLDVKDVEVFKFARAQLERAYKSVSASDALDRAGVTGELLLKHLAERRWLLLDNILRVLAAQDRSGKMRIIWRGIASRDARQRANSIEALEDSMDPALSRMLLPLLEDQPVSQSLALGRKHFHLERFNANAALLYSRLLSEPDWVTVLLTLHLILPDPPEDLDWGLVRSLTQSGNRQVKIVAKRIVDGLPSEDPSKEDAMESEISLPEKILHLRAIQIFQDLSVSELAAVASVTEEVVYPAGEVVIREGEPGDTMYLIIKGEVSVTKRQQGEEASHEIELDRIRAGDYFGEMALFEDVVRSATVRTAEESRLLVLNKQEFTEIVREYPQIALHICRVLSDRIRRLHQKIQSYEKA
jgi:Cyclic nucleotide-binding domain/TLC ATP/ADP transporter